MTRRIIMFMADSFGQPVVRQPPVRAVGNGQPLGGSPFLSATAVFDMFVTASLAGKPLLDTQRGRHRAQYRNSLLPDLADHAAPAQGTSPMQLATGVGDRRGTRSRCGLLATVWLHQPVLESNPRTSGHQNGTKAPQP